MKFSIAWANVINENNLLKFVVVLLLASSVVFSVALVRLSVRQPILIERGCESRFLTTADSNHTNKELEMFMREVIPMRFDSNAADFRSLLSNEEIAYRIKEQEDLKKKSLLQKIVVNSIKQEGNGYIADTDRILSAGKLRSATQFPLRLEIASVPRTVSNPYGLILIRVSQFTEPGGAK